MDVSSETLLDKIVHRLADWQLETPGMAFLQAHKPFGFVGSQALLLLQPLLDEFVPRSLTTEWVTLMSDRDQLDRLIARLDAVRKGTAVSSINNRGNHRQGDARG